MNCRYWLVIPCLAVGFQASAQQDCSGLRPQEVARCHVEKVRQAPLQYRLEQKTPAEGYTLYQYRMTSQTWAPEPVVEPRLWEHRVELFVPDVALPEKALVVVNNGVRFGEEQQTPDYSPEALGVVAVQARTVVASISDVPNQYVTFSDAQAPMREDDAVAHTWAHALHNDAAAPELPLHLPMAAAASRAMDLTTDALPELRLERFIITGASKRGWSSWLTAVADDRVIAIVPSVIDVADTSRMLAGLRKRYGGSWPLALWPYQAAGVLQQLGSPAFERLMGLMDPMQYLDEPEARLEIPKYLVSASGDDFFAPDPATDYLQRMPGQTSLRVLPNSDHGGVRAHVASTLVPMVQRIQARLALPRVQVTPSQASGHVQVRLSEMPVALKVWTAENRTDRDFRHACGVRYTSQTITPSEAFSLDWTPPAQGWQARFVEARFADGFIATSPVSVLPQTYPEHPPADQGGACRSFPAGGK
ncbi:PhoPQ-activated pathogenicity-related family protein [Pseudomonas sp. KU43P]|uniref:PhoPQ-activated pathogenicity-related family protein n=1 Tax=Pseudomonas sp. KU43P TaxID=2487887 RepID=UPI0012AA4D05|nr:PhoPQ-activated pathogenicity-related family protein [Pseudomonas sp. KU43P]BBH43879.1 hypothetical protein KU43P_03560 [Pseudomonas sp. KU43P]